MEATATAPSSAPSSPQSDSPEEQGEGSVHPLPPAPSNAEQQKGQMPGAQLKRIRTYLGLSLTKFGELIGRSRQWVSHYEKGRKPIPASVADRALRLLMKEALEPVVSGEEDPMGEELVMDVVRLYNAAKHHTALNPNHGADVIVHRAREILEDAALDVPKDIGVAMVVSVVTTLSLVPEPHEY